MPTRQKKQFYKTKNIKKVDSSASPENIQILANQFIKKYQNELYLLPLCGIAELVDNQYPYMRQIYRDFCALSLDTQNCIFKMYGINMNLSYFPKFYEKCVKYIYKKMKLGFRTKSYLNDIDYNIHRLLAYKSSHYFNQNKDEIIKIENFIETQLLQGKKYKEFIPTLWEQYYKPEEFNYESAIYVSIIIKYIAQKQNKKSNLLQDFFQNFDSVENNLKENITVEDLYLLTLLKIYENFLKK